MPFVVKSNKLVIAVVPFSAPVGPFPSQELFGKRGSFAGRGLHLGRLDFAGNGWYKQTDRSVARDPDCNGSDQRGPSLKRSRPLRVSCLDIRHAPAELTVAPVRSTVGAESGANDLPVVVGGETSPKIVAPRRPGTSESRVLSDHTSPDGETSGTELHR